MAPPATPKPPLHDLKIHVKVKLAALWTSLMFCYIYGDFFGLFAPGKLKDMMDGNFGPLGPTTPGILVGVSLLLAVPGLMVFLSLALTPAVSKWLNVVLGIFYTVIMLLTLPGAYAYYIVLGVIEVIISLLIAYYAWRWPRSFVA